MAETIKAVYSDVEVEYDESDNRWRFELNGKERHASSLALAKQAIDKPEPKKKKTVDPLPAWKGSPWSSGWEKVTVTSIAETGYRGVEVWVVNSKGKRSKERLIDIFADTPANTQICKDMAEIEKKKTEFDERKRQLLASVDRLDVSAWQE